MDAIFALFRKAGVHELSAGFWCLAAGLFSSGPRTCVKAFSGRKKYSLKSSLNMLLPSFYAIASA